MCEKNPEMRDRYPDNPTAFVQWLREDEPEGRTRGVFPQKGLHEMFKRARAEEVIRANTALLKVAGLVTAPQPSTDQTY